MCGNEFRTPGPLWPLKFVSVPYLVAVLAFAAVAIGSITPVHAQQSAPSGGSSAPSIDGGFDGGAAPIANNADFFNSGGNGSSGGTSNAGFNSALASGEDGQRTSIIGIILGLLFGDGGN